MGREKMKCKKIEKASTPKHLNIGNIKGGVGPTGITTKHHIGNRSWIWMKFQSMKNSTNKPESTKPNCHPDNTASPCGPTSTCSHLQCAQEADNG